MSSKCVREIHFLNSVATLASLNLKLARFTRARLEIEEMTRCLKYPYSIAGASRVCFSCQVQSFGNFLPEDEVPSHRPGHNYMKQQNFLVYNVKELGPFSADSETLTHEKESRMKRNP